MRIRWTAVSLIVFAAAALPAGNTEAAPPGVVVVRQPLIRTVCDREMFPVAWRAKLFSTPLGRHQMRWATAEVRTALSYYPPRMVRRYVDRIYIVDRLYLSGMNIGGTRSSRRVYLAAGSASLRGGHSLARRLHAEISSILMLTHTGLLSQREWHAANPALFRYVGSGVEAVRQGRTGLNARPDLIARGFLHTYAMSSLENDFNAVASALMLSETRLTNLAVTSPRLKRKIEITKNFYRQIDPWFVQRFPRSVVIRQATR